MSNMKNERQLRYALGKAGYALRKSRARNWSVHDQCGYMIIDPYYNAVVCGSDFELTLEDVREFVEEDA